MPVPALVVGIACWLFASAFAFSQPMPFALFTAALGCILAGFAFSRVPRSGARLVLGAALVAIFGAAARLPPGADVARVSDVAAAVALLVAIVVLSAPGLHEEAHPPHAAAQAR